MKARKVEAMSEESTSTKTAASRTGKGAVAGKQSRKRKKSDADGSVAAVVARTITRVEKIHRDVAALPLDLLERMGDFEKPVARVRKLQGRSITTTWDLVRGINDELTKLAKTQRRAGSKRKTKAHKARSVRRDGPEARNARDAKATLRAVASS
jgi:hypothetical protein